MRLWPMLALLSAACSPGGDSVTTAASPTEGSAPVSAAVRPAIDGEWRLVEMNDQPAPTRADPDDAHHPITLTVGDVTLRAQSQCVAFWRRYAWTDGGLTVTPDNPGAMCARGLSTWETEFDRTLSAVNRAERTGDRLVLSGPGARLVFEAGPTVAPTRITGRWRLHALNGASSPAGEPPLEITVSAAEIKANACVFAGWRYRQDGPLLELTPSAEPVCERTRTESETRFGRFMDGVSRATVLENDALILDSAAHQAEFRRIG